MATEITYLEAEHLITLRYEGIVDRHALMETLAKATLLAREKETHSFLADCSHMAAEGHTLADLFFGVKEIAEGSTRVAGFREAILRPQDAEADKLVSFWETAGHNRGLNIRIFDDRASALDWLRQ